MFFSTKFCINLLFSKISYILTLNSELDKTLTVWNFLHNITFWNSIFHVIQKLIFFSLTTLTFWTTPGQKPFQFLLSQACRVVLFLTFSMVRAFIQKRVNRILYFSNQLFLPVLNSPKLFGKLYAFNKNNQWFYIHISGWPECQPKNEF